MNPSDVKVGQIAYEYEHFITLCARGNWQYSLTPSQADPNIFASLFALFGLYTINSDLLVHIDKPSASAVYVQNLDNFKTKRTVTCRCIFTDKPYLQLLCFTLTALAILDTYNLFPLESHINPFLKRSINADLDSAGVSSGSPGSGNIAMFHAVIRLYAAAYLRLNVSSSTSDWVSYHLDSMNKHGFWSPSTPLSSPYLQFQNGYHQYEIFEYLNLHTVSMDKAKRLVLSLQDSDGRFAPYPGGGGCYDYDAAYILLKSINETTAPQVHDSLFLLYSSLISSQNLDGGFSESRLYPPSDLQALLSLLQRAVTSSPSLSLHRSQYIIKLFRRKNHRYHPHWASSSFNWNTSDLWNSWFRILAIFRIGSALFPSTFPFVWNRISFPGIGYSR